jgi:hypothetical protein
MRLFDHLVGTGEQGRRHIKAERVRGVGNDTSVTIAPNPATGVILELIS